MSTDSQASPRHQHPLLPLEVQEEYRRLRYWEDITLADIVQRGAERHADRIAITGETQLTYGQLWDQARRLAGTLQQEGLQPGEFVLAVMANSWQGIVLEAAASVAGAALAPQSANVSPALALNTFEQLDCRGLVLQADLLEKPEWRETVAHMSARLKDRPVMLRGDGPADVRISLQLEAAARNGSRIDSVRPVPCQPCLVLSTGGTTGTPKSILHCSETLVYAARQFGEATGYSESDVHVAFAPYGHAGGSVFEVYMPLLYGASILPIARWRPQPVAEAIERWGGTYFITMGTHIFDLLTLDSEMRSRLRSVRVVTSGAGPDSLFEDGERELGFPIVRVYGCSECPGHAIGRLDDPAGVRLRQDGIPFPGIEHRIVDTFGESVEPGKPGEYQCRGPNLFMGYAQQPEVTARAVTEDGFYRSGDLMVQSPQGYVNWSGRTKDIIRRGGLQIDPIEMETMLVKHPKVAMVVVVGEPHPRLGERAVIVAVPERADESLTLDELCGHLTEQGLPKQNLPERLIVTDDIPRTELGKFHRVKVKVMVAETADRSLEHVG
jgi:acyl-coenzyme A synthetase/AMP-(fatty) acid ligase